MISSVNGEPVAEVLNQKTAEEKLAELRNASNFEAINCIPIENVGIRQIRFIKAEKKHRQLRSIFEPETSPNRE